MFASLLLGFCLLIVAIVSAVAPRQKEPATPAPLTGDLKVLSQAELEAMAPPPMKALPLARRRPYSPPPPDGSVAPPGHVVIYPAEMPTKETASGNLQPVFSSSNWGTVSYTRKDGVSGEISALPYSLHKRERDKKVYFIVPENALAPVLGAGDHIEIRGYSGQPPELFHFQELPAGYYNMGYHLLLQAPHRFVESSLYDDIDAVPAAPLATSDVTADGCVITIPPLPAGAYALKVGFGNQTFATPVLFEFDVR